MEAGTFCILRGVEVMIRGIRDHGEAVILAEELAYTNSQPLVVVKVLDIIPGKMEVR